MRLWPSTWAKIAPIAKPGNAYFLQLGRRWVRPKRHPETTRNSLKTIGFCKPFTGSLTTGLNVLTGTSGVDTFVGTLDLVATSQTINLGETIDGTAGVDTFKLYSNVLAAANNNTGLSLTNVEKVEIGNLVASAASANLQTFNATNAVGVQEVAAISIGDVMVTNIGTAALGARGFVSNNGATQTLSAAGANTLNLGGVSVGKVTSSLLNVDISAGTASAAQAVVVNSTGTANTISDLKIGNATVGASSLTINAATNFKTAVTELSTAANKLKTITASGAATTVDIGTIASTVLTSVDATGLTVGGMKVGIGANPVTTFKGGLGNDTLTIIATGVMTGASDAGAGTDTLAAGGAGGLVSAGKGGDDITLAAGIDTLVFKAATDSLQDFTGVAGVAGKGTMDAVSSFSSTSDKIDLTSFNFTSATTKVFVNKTFADTTLFTTAEASATFFQDATNITRGAVMATVSTDSYLVVDADHNGTFSAATDMVVKMTGVTTFVQGDIIWG